MCTIDEQDSKFGPFPQPAVTASSNISNLSGLLNLSTSLLTKLTNYFTVNDYHNYTSACSRLSKIVGALDHVEAGIAVADSNNDYLARDKFVMFRTQPQRLTISKKILAQFAVNLAAMRTLKKLTVIGIVDSLLSLPPLTSAIELINNCNSSNSSNSQNCRSLPRLSELEWKQCPSSFALLNLPKTSSNSSTNLSGDSLTHLKIDTNSLSCQEFGCPIHIYSPPTTAAESKEQQEWMTSLSTLKSLSLGSSSYKPMWSYPSMLNFPNLTYLHLSLTTSDIPNNVKCMLELDRLPELSTFSVQFSTNKEIPSNKYDKNYGYFGVLSRMKKLRTFDLSLLFAVGPESWRYAALQTVMEYVRDATQITSFSLSTEYPIEALKTLSTITVMTADADSVTTETNATSTEFASSFAVNLRSLRLNGNVGLNQKQNENLLTQVGKFTALTSLGCPSSLAHTKLIALPHLRELDLSNLSSSSYENERAIILTSQVHLNWLREFSSTLTKVVMPCRYLGDAFLTEYFANAFAKMSAMREIVLPISPHATFRELFVNLLRQSRPEIQLSCYDLLSV